MLCFGWVPSRCSIGLPPVTAFSGELIAECNARNVGGYSIFFPYASFSLFDFEFLESCFRNGK